MKRYLGLDLGSKTVGVALSESGIIAQTLTTIRFTEDHYDQAALEVAKIVKEYQINVIVLGLPKHMNNDIGIRGKISETFKETLLKMLNVDVILWDERLSSATARKAMILGTERRKTQKEKKDELAAVVILQNYLDCKGA